MLYICNKILEDDSLLKHIQHSDVVIFIEDGVYNLLKKDFVKNVYVGKSYSLTVDMTARKLNTTAPIIPASYEDFVNLCVEHDAICQI